MAFLFLGALGIPVVSIRIWECEAGEARFTPPNTGFLTTVPKEPKSCSSSLCAFVVNFLAHVKIRTVFLRSFPALKREASSFPGTETAFEIPDIGISHLYQGFGCCCTHSITAAV